ncbi:MAG: RluA family pseudouridine synthase [Ruminococcaceae bacterium]|nr:RluA family pseudouridine synthase [Oscillospiraceae bacterium]
MKYKNYVLPVIYEDNHVISVVKPGGILSQCDISGDTDMLTIIKNDIKVRYEKPGNVFLGLIHRLDRNTGGTMIFAKTSKGASRLSEQLRNKKMYKGYFAIVEGVPGKENGYLINRLEKNEKDNTVRESKNGKECVLYYETVAVKAGLSLIFAVPITGRTHQIRVQMSLSGHPLLGDTKYGNQKSAAISKNTYSNDKFSLALWSSVIAVKHPTEDRILKLCSIPEQKDYWTMFEACSYSEFSNAILNERFDEFTSLKDSK